MALLLFMGIGLWPVYGATEAPVPAYKEYQQRAAALEAQGDLPQALLAWRVVAAMAPDNADARGKIESLSSGIPQAAMEHYRQGVVHFRARELEKARYRFLAVLRLNPNHAQALFYLKRRLNNPDTEVYTVQPGDSFTQIAAAHYNDARKADTIAFFNDLPPDKPLRVDTPLLLPELGGAGLPARQQIDAMLLRAQVALDEKKYIEVLEITSPLGEAQYEQKRIQILSDEARFGQGMRLMEQNQYQQALEMLSQVSRRHKERDRAIQQARKGLQAQDSDEKLRLAQNRLKQGAYQEAILVCGQVLEVNPGHPKAQALLEAARYALGKQYLEQGEEMLAKETLKALRPEYQDTAQLMAQAQGRLNARAEEYYRRGVKHFLDEELEEAVGAWQKSLEMNPQHPKARQDRDNALRLLDKWRSLKPDDKKGQ
jgi:tetratricopeptide (TPR) repeat protein